MLKAVFHKMEIMRDLYDMDMLVCDTHCKIGILIQCGITFRAPETKLVIIVLTDGLALKSAKPSARTVMII